MNWEQAKKELDRGMLICLPDMEGHWKKETHKRESAWGPISRYTSIYWYRDGQETIEAPMHDPKYIERTDWQILPF